MAFPTWVEVVTGGWVVHSRHGVEGEGVARSLRNARYVKQICKRSRCKCVCVCQGLAGVAVWWRATPCDRWLSTVVVVVVVYEALFCHVMLFCLFFLCLSSFVCPLFFLPLIFLCMSLFLLLIICLLLFFLHSSSSSFLILCLLVLFFLLDTLPLTCHLSSWYSTSYVSSSFLHPLPSWYSLNFLFPSLCSSFLFSSYLVLYFSSTSSLYSSSFFIFVSLFYLHHLFLFSSLILFLFAFLLLTHTTASRGLRFWSVEFLYTEDKADYDHFQLQCCHSVQHLFTSCQPPPVI